MIQSLFTAYARGMEIIVNIAKLGALGVDSVTILSITNYYPFGMEMPNRNGNTGNYRFGFQGQEIDKEIKGEGNSVNYKYRMHDPRLGRFFAVDPLAAKYPHNSVYAFSENMVIHMIELEGLEAYPSQAAGYLDPKLKNNPDWQRTANAELSIVNDIKIILKWFDEHLEEGALEGNYDQCNTGGRYGGQDGWNNGGRRLLFGTFATVLTLGGSSIVAASGEGLFLLETTGAVLSVDDMSTVFFDNNETALTELLLIDPEDLDKVKTAVSVGQFATGLHNLISTAIENPEISDDAFTFASTLLNELNAINAFIEAQQNKSSEYVDPMDVDDRKTE